MLGYWPYATYKKIYFFIKKHNYAIKLNITVKKNRIRMYPSIQRSLQRTNLNLNLEYKSVHYSQKEKTQVHTRRKNTKF